MYPCSCCIIDALSFLCCSAYCRLNHEDPSKLPLGFRGSVVINQPGKMAENLFLLINAGPRLNTGLEKSPGQNCRILNKRRGRLIEKIRYINGGVVLCVEINTVEFNYLPNAVSLVRGVAKIVRNILRKYMHFIRRVIYIL